MVSFAMDTVCGQHNVFIQLHASSDAKCRIQHLSHLDAIRHGSKFFGIGSRFELRSCDHIDCRRYAVLSDDMCWPQTYARVSCNFARYAVFCDEPWQRACASCSGVASVFLNGTRVLIWQASSRLQACSGLHSLGGMVLSSRMASVFSIA